MNRRLAAVSAFALVGLASAPALAQAPGDCACAVPAPVEAPRKIGVGLRMTGMGLHPNADPEAHSSFSGGGLAVSYRVRPRWGIVLTADGFTEQLEDGSPGMRQLQAGSLSATFHVRPYSRWNPYLIAGLDAVAEVTDAETDPTTLAGAHLGAGLEYRWRRFGFSAELRMIGLAEPEEDPAATRAQGMGTEAPPEGISAGQVSLGASYYF